MSTSTSDKIYEEDVLNRELEKLSTQVCFVSIHTFTPYRYTRPAWLWVRASIDLCVCRLKVQAVRATNATPICAGSNMLL